MRRDSPARRGGGAPTRTDRRATPPEPTAALSLMPGRYSLLSTLPGPAVLVLLPAPRDAEALVRHVHRDRRTRRDERAAADGDGRHELRVAPDEGAVANHCGVLVRAVVVARDDAGPHVHVLTNRRVAEIREMARLGRLPQRRLLELDVVAHARGFPDVAARTDVGERTHLSLRPDERIGDDAVVEDDDVILESGIDKSAAGVNLAGGSHPGPTLEVHVRVEDGVVTDLDVGTHIRRRRIDDRHPGRHQLLTLGLSHHGAGLGQFGLAVDAPNLVGHRRCDRVHLVTHPAEGRDDFRKGALDLDVLPVEGGQGLPQGRRRAGKHPTRTLPDGALLPRGVLFGDQADDLAPVLPKHPQQPVRAFRHGGHDGHRRRRPAPVRDQRAQRGRAEHGDVGWKDEQDAVGRPLVGRPLLLECRHGMYGTQLGGLRDNPDVPRTDDGPH